MRTCTFHKRIINTTHGLSHPSARVTKRMIAQQFVWPNMQKQITQWIKTCLPCQRSKIHRHNVRCPEHIQVPDDRFHHIHIDIVGPLPICNGYRYCLTMMDRTTRWPETASLKDITADTVVITFFNTWVTRFGAPAMITMDRGAQLEAPFFQAMIKLVGSQHTILNQMV